MKRFQYQAIKFFLCLTIMIIGYKSFGQQDDLRIMQVVTTDGNYIGGTTRYVVIPLNGININSVSGLFKWDIPHCTILNPETGYTDVTKGNEVQIKWDINYEGGIVPVDVTYLPNPNLVVEQNDGILVNSITSINDAKVISAFPNKRIKYQLNFPRIAIYDNSTFQKVSYVDWYVDGAESVLFTMNTGSYNEIVWDYSDFTTKKRIEAICHYGYYEWNGMNFDFVEEASDFLIIEPSVNFIAASSEGHTFCYNCTTIPNITLGEVFQDPNGTIPIASYQWQISDANTFVFTNIVGATNQDYNFTTPLTNSVFIRRRVTLADGTFSYSNYITLKLTLPAKEDINYIKEYSIFVPDIINICQVFDLQIGQKKETTTYYDGLGRSIEKINKGVAIPTTGSLWGDIVQSFEYDSYGRVSTQYLPYSTTTAIGNFKGRTITYNEQINYYEDKLEEGIWAKGTVTFDESPLNRVINSKSPGEFWNNNAGSSMSYELNDFEDKVQILAIDNINGSFPYSLGVYPKNKLSKTKLTDVNGKQVIEFRNNNGQTLLRKVQLDNTPTSPTQGWISTYSIYDDFGRLRFQIQPEGVKYFEQYLAGDNLTWTFDYTGFGNKILDEQTFSYEYDEKGRNIFKKAPGAKPLYLIYDNRDRVVLMQDGNQRALTPLAQWTANIYDELDRLVITTLYNTNKTAQQLRDEVKDLSSINTTVTTNTSGTSITNLILDNRSIQIPTPATPVSRYSAQKTIEFVTSAGGSFESNAGDEFLAEIDANASASSTTVTTTTYSNLITATELNDPSICTILKYVFYDKYNFADAQPFYTGFQNTDAYPSSATVLPIQPTNRTLNFSTGSKERILGTNKFITTTNYFNENEQSIQSIVNNIMDGQDITTVQYSWDGRLLSTHSLHSTQHTSISNYSILTKNSFDKIGRITSLEKRYGTASSFKTIATYAYDDMGRLQTKVLAPGFNNQTTGKNWLEILDYSYNIHNQITGINKDYALKTPSVYDKWGNYFGLYLGFDNKDNVFANGNLVGQVTGLLWNTQGDDAQRKYDYTYDNAGRLTKAIFNQKQNTTESWSNDILDFSVTGRGSNNDIGYDLNGNLQSMIQRGVVIGNNTAHLMVDDLQYTYKALSNRLASVTDNATLTNNGSLGDFKDGTNSAGTEDYVYDENGNIVIDLNKNVKDLGNVAGNGIKYNFLDKPEEIRIAGKGLIKLVYSASGEKLRKIYKPENQTKAKYTTYVNQFVYEETVDNVTTMQPLGGGITPQLSYINFEEGRIRILKHTDIGDVNDAVNIEGSIIGSNNIPLPQQGFMGEGVFDYYIRDYQSNVRMILTEETHSSYATCKLEDDRDIEEQPKFGSPTKYDVASIPGQTNNPATNNGWKNPNIGARVSRLSRLTEKVGPSSLLKVMAGDEITAIVDYYYKNQVTNTPTTGLTTDVLTSLYQAINSSSVLGTTVKNAATNIVAYNSSTTIGNIAAPNSGSNTGTNPKAYITILFFDERFNYIPPTSGEGSAFERVREADAGNQNAAPLLLQEIKAPKNGYAYVYVSNESDEFVYFDNLKIKHERGRIIEENHYYAYGLKITGISSNKIGDALEGILNNKNLYNDKELIDDGDLGWYDYGFRNYDPQIGRFPQLDPLTFEYPYYTPYQYAGCEPIANVDVDGLEPAQVLAEVTVRTSISHSMNLANFAKTASSATSLMNSLNQVRMPHNWYIYTNSANHSFSQATFGGNTQEAYGTTWNYKGTYTDYTSETREIPFSPPPPSEATLSSYSSDKLSWSSQWKESAREGNFVSSLSYHLVDDVSLFVQGFTNHNNVQHIGGGSLTGSERERVGGNFVMMVMPVGGEIGIAERGIVSLRTVEQYSLRAAENGFYPVMKRGFAKPQELQWLNKGDVWKFGTSKNPLTRYSQSYLDNIGEYGVKYSTEFSGTLEQSLQLERMKLLNYRGQNGFLPPGNKILK